MKENELMIGDWVMYNPNVFIEDEYETAKEWFPTQINSGEDIDLAIEGCYAPIPLTTDILERNEFIKFAGQYVLKADKEPFIHLISLDNMPNANGSMLVAIKDRYINAKIAITYVHELQHALRLCRIEKEIEL